ncbi:Outer membrane efflux protein precursor [Flavobacterium indicum GPTSA100-9 = DSM 17447]|uniref:Outer membrane efflux protein n=1 Tax=Flavobacterium indicum (strain DSM 17447 / CIP 109464 / GPTSA100-9) TaxID=1094466 RepID=H8XUZ6_FLAIG|nr:TolC family protein [Flavobacterium indicum]CCG52966.1 Outer membrane efflux protein precursor [Flavobacterium indicum GPTSA100-9 = DSM 17447]
MKCILKFVFGVLLYSLLYNPVYAQTNYTLQKALQTARANNPYLKTEQLNIGIAQTDIITAKLRPNPILNNQSLQLMQPSQFPASTDWYNGQNRQVWWQLTKPFQVAGQRKYKIDVANKNVSFAEKNYSETERHIFSEVASKWLEVWTAQKQLEIIQIAKSNIDSLVLTNQIRYKNQVITQTDLFRTELLSKQYAIQYKTALQEVINRQNELKFLLGVQEDLSIDANDNFLFTMHQSIDSLLKQSLQNRSDIQTVKSLIDVSNSNIKLQKSLAFPQPELGFIWNPQNTIPYFGIYATVDLPFFNRNQGEIKKSYLLKDQAETQLFTIQTQIQTEISVAFANYQLQQQNLESFNMLLQQSQTILDNVKYAYLKGGTTIIDFLEAQRSWLETQQQYYDAMQAYRQSYIQLLYATGLINQLAL